ncbi:hypothetical protein [Arthrobacter sp. ISL-95]|uniref:hypothetical protein n=1 Tax=Arthrobacter sp. ISL-95 TaxID=2819116 RepID=UPI001BE927BD|nr:hypothetical protein [Arthrobacter sp. ISL-95]MBT2588376.1 hypothetical protein [Arthrobacter sp. ISL-95]
MPGPRGSAPEIIDDGTTGFLRRGVRELADALHQIGTLDRSICRRTAETRFSAERMVAEHLQPYENALTGAELPATTG